MAAVTLRLFDKIQPQELDRRELHLTLLACSTILVLGAGLALLMYPLVFSRANAAGNLTLRNAFYGFCGLSGLLAMYLVDRQLTILRLRRQIAEDHRRAAESKIEASAERGQSCLAQAARARLHLHSAALLLRNHFAHRHAGRRGSDIGARRGRLIRRGGRHQSVYLQNQRGELPRQLLECARTARGSAGSIAGR